MRKGRNKNCLWNYFTRCERQVFRNQDETVPIITKMIAKCNKCQIAICTNLDAMANHILFGDDTWSGTAKKQARDIIDSITNTRTKRKRTLTESNEENATTDHSQVCILLHSYIITILY